MYFSESPAVARSYKEGLTGGKNATVVGASGASADLPAWLASRIESEGIDGAIREWTQRVAEAESDLASSIQPWMVETKISNLRSQLDAMKKVAAESVSKVERPGALYEVDIPDSAIANMLDWDAPLAEQPEIVAKLKTAG